MNFSENLQTLRKEKNLSQEQLAEKLEISRQAVSKWESGTSYPEIEKLITMCELFNCSMDSLVKGEIKENSQYDKKKSDRIFNKFAKAMSLGVFLCFIGVSAVLFSSIVFKEDSVIGVVILLLFVLVATVIFIINGIEFDSVKEELFDIKNLYTKEDKKKDTPSFAISIALGVSIIMADVILLIMFSEVINDALLVGIFMVIMAFAASIFVYSGINYSKYDMEKGYKTEKDGLPAEKISSVIMITATIIYLFLGIVENAWHPGWIVFPIGGMLCAITNEIFRKQ